MKDIDQIKHAQSCPWQLLSSSLSQQTVDTAIDNSATTTTGISIAMGNSSNNESTADNDNTHNCGEILVQIMCVIFSENLGGFHPILSALFSQNPEARLHAVNILIFF